MSFPTIPRLLAWSWALAPILASLVAPPVAVRADQVEIRGKVVDAATGKPITSFVEQGGMLQEGRIVWGFWEKRTGSPNKEGTFSANIDWAKGERTRIMADGYAPQPVLAEVPPAGKKTLDIVVEMTRGRTVSGSVVDADGKPVSGASVFLVGQRPAYITGGKAVQGSGLGDGEDKTVTRGRTDKDGKFTLAGSGDDVDRVVVSAPGLDYYVAPAPDDFKAKVAIRLPRPATLVLKYDIPGGPAEGEFYLYFYPPETGNWKGITNERNVRLKNGGEVKLANLTPGKYTMSRMKSVKLEDRGIGGMLESREFTVKPGESHVEAITRKGGAPITGRIEGIDRAKMTGPHLSVYPGNVEPKPFGTPKFDTLAAKDDGTFTTEALEPGEYLVVAESYAKQAANGRLGGIERPAFSGKVKVTVPKVGKPKPVTITLK